MSDATFLRYEGRLMLTITSASKFKTMNVPLETPEQREHAAKIQIDGWVSNGGYDRSQFTIEHGKTQPIRLSRMVDDILTRSRAELGT